MKIKAMCITEGTNAGLFVVFFVEYQNRPNYVGKYYQLLGPVANKDQAMPLKEEAVKRTFQDFEIEWA